MSDLPNRTHNAPPDPLQASQEDMHERLKRENGDMDIRVQQLEEAAERGEKKTVDSEEVAEAFTEQLAQITRAAKELEDRRTRAKAPFLMLAGLVDNYFKRRVDRLEAARKKLSPKLTAWQTLKAQRARDAADAEAKRQRDEAERIRREREAKEAAEAEAAMDKLIAEAEADNALWDLEQAKKRLKQPKQPAAPSAIAIAAAAGRAMTPAPAGNAPAAAPDIRQLEQRVQQATTVAAQAADAATDANRAARQVRQQEVQQETITQHVEQQAKRAGGSADTRVRGMYGAKAVLRKVFDFRIEDPTKVPRAYCSPDDAKIRAAINGESPVTRIQGVKIFEKQTTQVRN